MVRRFTLALFCTILYGQNAFTATLTAENDIDVTEDSAKMVDASRKWYTPQFIPIQYAGNIGLISSGIGYASRRDNYQISMLYGYAPKSVTGVSIHTITAKNTFNIYRLRLNEQKILIPYVGLGVSIEVGGRSFLTLPPIMRKGYYEAPKSVHMIASGGLKIRHTSEWKRFLSGADFFMEATTIDAYIWYKFLSDEIKLTQVMSLSFGVNLLLK